MRIFTILDTLPHAVVVSAGLAFVAAFLNAVFGLCIGCDSGGDMSSPPATNAPAKPPAK